MTAWPTPPAELRRAVAMLAGFHDLQSFEAFCGRGPSPVGPFDRELGIAVTLAPDHAVATLIAMRMAVHETPAIGEPTSPERFQRWVWGWADYRQAVGLLDDVVAQRYVEADDLSRAQWWEACS